MGIPTINTQDLPDIITQRNFENILSFLRTNSPLLGFKFFTITFPNAVTNYKFPHNLGFLPKDIVSTSLTGSGSVAFNYSLFDSKNLDLTTTGPCVIRFFVGTYQSGAT